MNGKPQRIDFLDHLRGVAIALVFGIHAFGESGGQMPHWGQWFVDIIHNGRSYLALFPFTYGWLGVAIFFVISGFCIHLSYEQQHTKDFRTFFVRRFFRIYPPYFVAIVLFSFVITPYQVTTTLWDLITHVFLFNNLDKTSFHTINSSFWTIGVEVQLYALYPFLVLVARRFGWGTALWLAATVTFSIKTYDFIQVRLEDTLIPVPIWIWHGPFRYWFSWTLGAKLADDFLQRRTSMLSRVPVWVWPLLTILSGILKPLEPFAWEFTALATGRVIAHLLARPLSQNFLAHPVIRHFQTAGIASYSMYLLHQPVLSWLHRYVFPSSLTGDIHPFLIFLLCIAAWVPILSLAGFLYRFIEIPSINLGKRFLRQRQLGPSTFPELSCPIDVEEIVNPKPEGPLRRDKPSSHVGDIGGVVKVAELLEIQSHQKDQT
jgi:peptidoglycan/LPS O-acetylase OafA/YrhL